MAAVGYFACGNSNISTFYMMFRLFEVFFSRISAVLVFFKILANKGINFRKPYHILRNLQKLSEFPPIDFLRAFLQVGSIRVER